MNEILFDNGITLGEREEINLSRFCALLLEKNKAFNLTAIREEREVFEKHFADSLKGSFLFEEGKRILEVGSGGGFPSVPLKISNEKLDFTLLEATGKKCEFLKEVKETFGFEKFEVVNARAEEYAKTSARQSFDIVTARAVASLNVLCELCLPFLKVGGIAVFYKQKSQEELDEGKNAIKLLGGKIDKIFDYRLASSPENERWLVVVKKIGDTSEKYPREYKKISKSPL